MSVEHPAVEEGTAPVDPVMVSDDLEIIEGIGPKIAALLRQAGITSFSSLAAADLARLDEILAAANLHRIADPATWAKQAGLAADGKWDELKDYQSRLKGGKEQ
jgi:predicted flap endonuclease-1-like 5' DNA nuclease